MAFGLGFNKAKALSAAEKLVAQGKIPAAIEEYRKLVERDKKDIALLNTYADLCIRGGKTEDALKCFQQLAENCLEGGQVQRAIATYKRISKIAPESIETIMKLGELYSTQGLLRESREYFLQAVDYYSQHRELDKAREVFEKILMLDMENPQLQFRMAELYTATSKKPEAISTYLSAAERYLAKGQPSEALTALKNLQVLDPQNVEARILQARALLDQNTPEQAVATLQALPSLESHQGALALLFQAQTKQGDASGAAKTAQQLLELHSDFTALGEIADGMIERSQWSEVLELYRSAFDTLVSQNSVTKLVGGLRKLLAAQTSDVSALELLHKVYQEAGNAGDSRDITENLAHVYRQSGELDKARELYKQLAAIEPDNPDYVQLLRRVESQMGLETSPDQAAAEPAAAMMSEITDFPAGDEPAPPEPPALSAHEEQIVKDCITEAELYITYRQFDRALKTIEAGLVQLPGNIALTEQLLSICDASSLYARAAECCEALTEAYVRLGDGERASRYGERLLGYQQKSQESAAGAPQAPSADESQSSLRSVGQTEAAAFDYSSATPEMAAEEQPGDQAQVREVDLSMEWASAATTPAATADDSLVEEIEFYLQASLLPDAAAALQRLKESSPANPAIAGFEERLGLNATPGAATPSPEAAVEAESAAMLDLSTSEPAVEPAALGFDPTPEPSEPEPASIFDLLGAPEPEATPEPVAPQSAEVMWPVAAATSAPEPAPLGLEEAPPIPAAPAAERQLALDEALPALGPAAQSGEFELSLEDALGMQSAAAPAAGAATPPQASAPPAAADPFASLAGDLEGALNLPEMAAPKQAPAAAKSPAGPGAGVPPAARSKAESQFDEILADFKSEMEEITSSDDMETHFNMGIAFKEMALYDEAIGEFQKAHQLAGRSNDHSRVVQYCSLLATCFLEKGLPQLAVKWYQTALDSPGLEPESVLALLYEMGSASETAGDRTAALRSFLEVYARNIDYRDVAERIRSLQQP